MSDAEGTVVGSGNAAAEKVAELRSAPFDVARRGFDREQVETYLRRFADWLEETALADPDEMRRELNLVGERTSEILTKAEEAARELRAQAQRSAAESVARAEAEAERLVAEAEEEARRVRLEADSEASRRLETAEQRSEQLSGEAVRRRRAAETVIEDLVARRDEIVAEIQRLVLELSDVVETDGAEYAEPVDDEAELEDEVAFEEDEEAELEPFGRGDTEQAELGEDGETVDSEDAVGRTSPGAP